MFQLPSAHLAAETVQDIGSKRSVLITPCGSIGASAGSLTMSIRRTGIRREMGKWHWLAVSELRLTRLTEI
jgi:hypothetical protein